ncbi:Methylamine utilisation protein MauE [Micromonospora halophytica]|uniref:Methylamine utilisation protein MauE n=2 Tax=Micromonospora halophytica TaxID=47864 RepID=A0A1C5J5P5_9ACTN|nr:Methylamine utilisation protein MauE [Micromonospora halophytica]
MRHLELTARLLLALVFLAAVVGKLRTRSDFADFVATVGRFGVPARWTRPVARAAVAAEAAVVVLLVTPGAAPAGSALAVALLGVLTAALVAALRRGERPACRCFGAGDTPIGRRHVLRNLALGAVALLGLAAGLNGGGGSPSSSAAVLLAAGVALPLAAVVVRLDDLVALFAPAPSRPTRPAGRP